jgi:hypothetical protein
MYNIFLSLWTAFYIPVIKEIGDVESSYTDTVTAQCKNILSTLKVGDTVVAKDFIKNMPKFIRQAGFLSLVF